MTRSQLSTWCVGLAMSVATSSGCSDEMPDMGPAPAQQAEPNPTVAGSAAPTPDSATAAGSAAPTPNPADAGAAQTPPASDASAAPEASHPPSPSVGSTPICDPDSCRDEAQRMAARLRTPAPGTGRTFVGGRCEMVGIVGGAEGPTCICDVGGGGSIDIGPDGAGCFAVGHAGDCLWSDAEYDACSQGADDACPAMCAELQARYAADAEATFDAEVRHSECSEGYCHSVLRIDDQCYADSSYQNGLAFDCALDDATILAQYEESQRPKPPVSCSDPAAASGGACVSDAPSFQDCVVRPADEWQGNRVCGPYPPCERSDHCGIALACIAQQCRACTQDGECAAGEGCALDHCLPATQIACHSRRDCAAGSLCILSGITGGTARGNEDMRAYCLSVDGGAPSAP